MCIACVSPVTTYGAGRDGAIKQLQITKISAGMRQGSRDLSFSFFPFPMFNSSPSYSFVVFSIIAQFFHKYFQRCLFLMASPSARQGQKCSRAGALPLSSQSPVKAAPDDPPALRTEPHLGAQCSCKAAYGNRNTVFAMNNHRFYL